MLLFHAKIEIFFHFKAQVPSVIIFLREFSTYQLSHEYTVRALIITEKHLQIRFLLNQR